MTFSVPLESSEQTLERILSAYELGRKLRHLRLRKKIGLVELGRHTGLSASMLSQLETGRLVPTLPTLARIAMVFDVGLDYFFAQRRHKQFVVMSAGERIRFPERPDVPLPSYFFECLAFAASGKGLQAYFAEFPWRPPAKQSPHFHEGSEFLYVIEGSMVLRFGDEEHDLKKGDSVYFDSTEPHSYRGGKRGARALVVTTPYRS